MQVNTAAEAVYELVDAECNLIFGAVVDPAMQQEVGTLPTNPVPTGPLCMLKPGSTSASTHACRWPQFRPPGCR